MTGKYDYYNQPYNRHCDTNSLTKKWRTIGGDIGFTTKLNKTVGEKSPGPGRYNPNMKSIKPKYPSYLIAEKLPDLRLFEKHRGTNYDVSPCSYELANKADVHKFAYSPRYTIGREKRKDNMYPKHTKNETYSDYSSLGNQMISPKLSEPHLKFNKAPRFRSNIN